MAAQDYYGVVQQLYISYFGRPADYFGLRNFADQLEAMDAPTDYEELAAAVEAGNNAGLTALVRSFNTSEESIALYGNDNSQLGMSRFVAAIYQNVLGREADPEGFDFWTKALANGEVTKANAAASITAAALKLEGEDAQTVQNKLAVATAFTDSLDTPSKFNAYAGEDAAAAARGLLQGVNADTNVDAYQATIDTTIDSIVNVSVPGETYTLTTSIDSFLGGAGNDNFVATITDTSNPIGALDVVDGGAGRDTLSIADSTTTGAALSLAGLTVRNVENLVVSSNRAYSAFDISTTGVTNASLTSAATTGTNTITAADTTDVTVAVAGTASATITGGKAVVVSGTGTNTVNGAALTGVTVNGGTAKINNVDGTDVESTLTSVTLNGVTGTDNAVVGDGVSTVNLTNIKAPAQGGTQTKVTVTNETDDGYTLNLNANAANVNVTAANATKVAVTAATASTITLTAADATSATIAGAGNLNLSLTGSDALTSLDASAATGNLTMTDLGSKLVSVKGGSGNDKISLGVAKYTIDTGAGNDVVTLTGALAAGSVINLGAGNDSLLSTGGSVAASTTTATTVIDAGDGFDTVSASLLNAANAGQFKNFEALDLSTAPANFALDFNLVTGSTITGLTLSAGAGGATLNNVKAGVGLSVAGQNTGTTTINVANATAADNVFGVTFNGAAVSGAAAEVANVKAGTVALNGVETVNIASTGAANTWNSIALTDNSLKTVTITGDKNLDLTFVGTNGTNASSGGGVKMIDGSAATGRLNINTTGVTADSAATGLTVKGGTAADTIILAGKATVDAGAGNDIIQVSAAGGTLTGGAGNDTFKVGAAVVAATGTVETPTAPTEASSVLTTITDLTAGDKIDFGLTAAKFGSTKVELGSSVTGLLEAITQAAAVVNTEATVTWFQYGTDTFVVADKGTDGFGAGDIVVKLAGLVDLSAATMTDTGIITL